MKRRVVVMHAGYGCETGCCGHAIEVDDERVAFDFAHADIDGLDEAEKKEAARKWAEELIRRELGEDHVKDLDWDECEIQDYGPWC